MNKNIAKNKKLEKKNSLENLEKKQAKEKNEKNIEIKQSIQVKEIKEKNNKNREEDFFDNAFHEGFDESSTHETVPILKPVREEEKARQEPRRLEQTVEAVPVESEEKKKEDLINYDTSKYNLSEDGYIKDLYSDERRNNAAWDDDRNAREIRTDLVRHHEFGEKARGLSETRHARIIEHDAPRQRGPEEVLKYEQREKNGLGEKSSHFFPKFEKRYKPRKM